MFEKWRVHDTSSAEKLQAEYEKDKQVQSPAEFAKKWDVDKQTYGGYDTDDLHGEYERDMAESNRRFDQAFRQVLSHTSALELQEFGKLVGLGDGVDWLADSGTGSTSGGATAANEQFTLGPATVEEGITHAMGVRKKRSHFADENPMFEQGDEWMTGTVKDGRADTIEFEHANPALDESGAAAAAERSQLEMRSI